MIPKNHLCFIFACMMTVYGHAALQDHFRKVENKKEGVQVRNVDFIYLINLDKRPERWKKSLGQLAPYNIVPHRFPAIYGWELSSEVLNDLGITFQQGMCMCPTKDSGVIYFSKYPNSQPREGLLNDRWYGKKILSRYLSKGAVGCFLSHLSVMQDAYDSGYETVWILEDDFSVKKDPHLISGYIDELDQLVGKDGWDILYTEEGGFYGHPPEVASHMYQYFPWFWRPDMPLGDTTYITEHTALNSYFYRIGTKSRAHSVIFRRSGMKKILDFEKTRGMFLPYDIEITFIPNLRLIALTADIIGYIPDEDHSDTKSQH